MNDALSITWWGHASTTLELDETRILTDPVLTGRLAHLSRIGGKVPDQTARAADAVVISHLHHDHLHPASLRLLDPGVRIVGPRGTRRVLGRSAPRWATRVEEVQPGDVVSIGPVQLRVTAALHEGRRTPLSRSDGQALGFILEAHAGDRPWRVWFAGDTGLFRAMGEFAPIDVAVVPIGGWGPTLGPTHLDPVQAAEAVTRVGASDAVPIHYGTFWPTGLRHVQPASFRRHFMDPSTRFVEALASQRSQPRAHVLTHGETLTLSARQR